MRALLLTLDMATCGTHAIQPPVEPPAGEPALDAPDAGPAPPEPQSTLEPRGPLDAGSLLALVGELPADRHPGQAGSARAREWLVARLADLGLAPRWQRFEWEGLPGIELLNLELRLGTGGGPIVVACAHYDSVRGTHGADDNGSGVAVLLALAQRMATRELPGELRLVWLDAEEVGLVGSRAYVAGLSAEERRRVVGCVNLESVGYADRRPGSQHMPPGSDLLHDVGDRGDFLLVLGNQASQELADVVALGLAAESGAHLRVEVFSGLMGAGWVMPDARRSDHASFWDVGLPAVMLTDTAPFRNPHYHRPGDRPETLDGPFLAAVARGVERALLLLLEDG